MSKTIEIDIEKVIKKVDTARQGYFLLPFSISEKKEQDFCVLIVRDEDNHKRTKPLYYIGFIKAPEQNPEQTPTTMEYKKWADVERETNINFTNMLSQHSEEKFTGTEAAAFSVPGHKTLQEMIKLCQDIVSSLRMGGYQPLDAGAYFNAYYSPRHQQDFSCNKNEILQPSTLKL